MIERWEWRLYIILNKSLAILRYHLLRWNRPDLNGKGLLEFGRSMPDGRITFKNFRLRFRYTVTFLGQDFDFCQAKKTWSWFTDEEGLKAFGCAAKLHLLYLWYIFPAPWDRIVGVAWAIMP